MQKLFATDCKADAVCDPELLHDPNGAIPEWAFPIQMRGDGKLERVS